MKKGNPFIVNLKSVFSSASYPVYALDKNFKFIYANNRFKQLIGKKSLVGKKCYDVFHCFGKNTNRCDLHMMLKRGKTTRSQVSVKVCDKKKFFSLELSPLRDKDGAIIAGLGVGKDITNNKVMREQIIRSNSELKVLNTISQAVSRHLDLSRLLNTAVDKVMEELGFDAGGVFLLDEDNCLVLHAYRGLSNEYVAAIRKLEPGKGSPWVSIKKGKPFIVEEVATDKTVVLEATKKEGVASMVNIPLKSKNGILGILGLASKTRHHFEPRDLSFLQSIGSQIGMAIENAKLHERAVGLARTDGLTGLYNFRYFEEILQKELQRSVRKTLTFALLIIDLDNLKNINDFYGHESGDYVMRKFADLLRLNLRDSDFYARYGGDEFVVLLAETDEKAATVVARKLISKTSKMRLFGFDNKPIITASVGIALYPRAATTPSSMLKAADLAMYQAKQDGRNCYCIYSPALLSTVQFNTKRLERIAQNADLSAIQTLVTAVDLKDNYTGNHSSEVSRLSLLLAKSLKLKESEIENLKVASLLHDVGKIGISDNILLKPSRLTKREYDQVKKHPSLGVSILKYSRHFKKALPIILHHHERFDGKGYPHGLREDSIPYLARLISVCDAYQAMVSDRPYRKAMTQRRALDQLRQNAGLQFDPTLVEAFEQIVSAFEQSKPIAANS